MIVCVQMIVFKFGGTTLLDEKQVVKNIQEGLKKYKKVSKLWIYKSPF